MTSVLTGDIINSTSVINQDLWLIPLKKCLKFVCKDDSKYEIFRGDSFQIEIKDITKSLRTAIYIKACIKSIKDFDVRIAIGIGSKTFEGTNISESNGSAFQNSGGLLEFMKRNKINLRIKADSNKPEGPYEFNKSFNIHLRFASLIMDSWTVNSAEAVKLLMETDYGNQNLIAKEIGISQDAVSKRLKRANIYELLELNELYEDQVKKL